MYFNLGGWLISNNIHTVPTRFVVKPEGVRNVFSTRYLWLLFGVSMITGGAERHQRGPIKDLLLFSSVWNAEVSWVFVAQRYSVGGKLTRCVRNCVGSNSHVVTFLFQFKLVQGFADETSFKYSYNYIRIPNVTGESSSYIYQHWFQLLNLAGEHDEKDGRIEPFCQ